MVLWGGGRANQWTASALWSGALAESQERAGRADDAHEIMSPYCPNAHGRLKNRPEMRPSHQVRRAPPSTRWALELERYSPEYPANILNLEVSSAVSLTLALNASRPGPAVCSNMG